MTKYARMFLVTMKYTTRWQANDFEVNNEMSVVGK